MLINPADIAAVADGVLVNAVWAIGRMVVRPRESHRAATAMEIAGWLDAAKLTREGVPTARLGLPGLTDAEAAELETALKRDEVQGALQALLAARLTDAPERDAAKAREVVAARLAARDAVRLAVGGAGTSAGTGAPELERRRSSAVGAISPGDSAAAEVGSAAARYAEQVSEYFDDKISALVATLEGRVGYAGLGQVRAEAYNSRIVALLGTISDMLAALSHPGRGGPEEAEFLRRYGRQVRERHGKIEPPDFERRRKIPVEKIYVNAPIHAYEDRVGDIAGERAAGYDGTTINGVASSVMDLAGSLDRTVLLGDPGGGKTTATSVIANSLARDPAGQVPFLVTLRDFAAKDPPERSVAGHIEHTLETLHQCTAPDGFVERLLLTERAVVIFDGLDELLDTSRRRDISELVEQFCTAYPLTPVLVTSRLVGYDQARLDDDRFTCYQLGDFGDDQITEYARKWFAIQDGSTTAAAEAEAESFLAESASAPDVRSNPLLLSLMCILYRGEGSLPRNRAEVYEQCANLLFRKWDARRRIHQELHAGHLVEPAIRHLAWWMFNRENPQTAVTERQLIAETTRFLHGRGFESEDEARGAAEEFVAFCRGRMWVFNEAGSAVNGEKLYAFAHRTFLEYFSAAHLAAVTDSPEDLAHQLAAHVENQGWNVLGELAIQIKDRNSDRGADRVYEALLSDAQLFTLRFLIRCLESVQPSPGTIRNLTKSVIDYLAENHINVETSHPLPDLLTGIGKHHEIVADEISNRISGIAATGDPPTRSYALGILLIIRWIDDIDHYFWNPWSQEQARSHEHEIHAESRMNFTLRAMALHCDIIRIADALDMPGGFGALMRQGTLIPVTSTLNAWLPAYPESLCEGLLTRVEADPVNISELADIGRYLSNSPGMPLVDNAPRSRLGATTDFIRLLRSAERFPALDEVTCLGFSAIVCTIDELKLEDSRRAYRSEPELSTGTALLLYRYLVRRRTGKGKHLPDLPVPEQFRQVFRDWAEGRVNFVELVEEEPEG